MRVKEIINCKVCNKEISKYNSYHYNQPPRKFCSRNCYYIYQSENPPLLGDKNHQWKGREASYIAKHMWVYNNFGKANKCENIDCHNRSKNYHWANLSGKYKRERNDWKMLCVSCHGFLDKSIFCKNGHKRTNENTEIIDGYRRCLTCRNLLKEKIL